MSFRLMLISIWKIYNWYPQFYNKTSDLPDLMPADLQGIINGLDENDKKVSYFSSSSKAWRLTFWHLL